MKNMMGNFILKIITGILVRVARLFGVRAEVMEVTSSPEQILLEQMESIDMMVETITGIRNRFMQEGFPEDIATEMTKDIVASSTMRPPRY